MQLVENTRFNVTPEPEEELYVGLRAPQPVLELLSRCPLYKPTPLHRLSGLASEIGVEAVLVKDEAERLRLQSFKALGGVYAVLRWLREELAKRKGTPVTPEELFEPAARQLARELTFVCASDGNHGRAVAAGARLVGANSVVYLHEQVSSERAERIAAFGGEVHRIGTDYDQSVKAAQAAAQQKNWTLIADTGANLSDRVPTWIMQAYTVIPHEVLRQVEGEAVTHVFVQAGVGGLAAAVAGHLNSKLGSASPTCVVVEPETSACLLESCRRNRATEVPSSHTIYSMLECCRPSPHAWQVLRTAARFYVAIPDAFASVAQHRLANPTGSDPQVRGGESGVAGVAALLGISSDSALRQQVGLDRDSVVLLINTEAAMDAVPEA